MVGYGLHSIALYYFIISINSESNNASLYGSFGSICGASFSTHGILVFSLFVCFTHLFFVLKSCDSFFLAAGFLFNEHSISYASFSKLLFNTLSYLFLFSFYSRRYVTQSWELTSLRFIIFLHLHSISTSWQWISLCSFMVPWHSVKLQASHIIILLVQALKWSFISSVELISCLQSNGHKHFLLQV